MNKAKSAKWGERVILRVALILALMAGAAIFSGRTTPVHALNPIMHNSSTTGSAYWPAYGGWGNSVGSKYGQFTCTTCHTAGTAAGGNAKQIRSSVSPPDGSNWAAPINLNSVTVVFGSYTAYGSDTLHATSTRICEVCHTQTGHHTYNNPGTNHQGAAPVDCNNNGACHVHSNGFKKPGGGGESSGGSACSGCHTAGASAPSLFTNDTTAYSMHSKIKYLSYRHFMSTDKTTNTGGNTAAVGTLGTSTYYNDVPSGLATNLAARRCLMCHVDHDQFKPGINAGNQRAYNLRASATTTPTAATRMNDDTNLCLSCHNTTKVKSYPSPDNQVNVPTIPYKNIVFATATTIINASPHGYQVKSAKFRDNTQFYGVCVKCHNDSIGGNGFSTVFGNLPKSSKNGQYSTAGRLPRFASHESTVQSKFSVMGNAFWSGYAVPAGSTTTQLAVAGTPWAGTPWDGYTLTLTAGAGSGGTSPAVFTVYSTSNNTLYLASGKFFSAQPDATTLFEISNSLPTVDNVCFNCHSKGTTYKPFAKYSTTDWYGQQYMGSRIAGMQSLFVGDSGTMTSSLSRKTTVAVTVQKTWGANALAGYQFKTPGGTRAILTNSAVTGPGSTTLTWTGNLTSNPGAFSILKPASHPLDTFGRHDSYERENITSSTAAWNKGDTGTTSTANSATAATQITDTTRLWSGTEFNGLTITFPGLGVSSTITGGAANTVTFSPAVAGLQTAGGDNYYVGSRHVACTDCHNTHGSAFNPEGNVSNGSGPNSLVASDSANVPGWTTDKWKGYLIRVRSSAGLEQVRYVTGFNASNGTYTVSLAWGTTPAAGYTYEVLMGDKWTSASQSGGRAGAGSGGMWGLVLTNWRVPTLGNMTTATTYKKIENVFDNLSTIGGSTIAGQRDLCVKCHTSYAYGVNTPMTPSGTAANAIARSTDVSKEFNPNNLAHHAIYARGNNQPVKANFGFTNISSTHNPYWPVYSTANAGDTVTVTSGAATFAGVAALPRTALPGWWIYVGSDTPGTNGVAGSSTTGYLEITSITDSTHFTVVSRNASGTPSSSITVAATANWFVTAGLGNAFVPPYGPWSILRCTDCHGSTKTDPVGPHASVNSWLIKDLDTAVSFEWMYGNATYITTTPNSGAASTKYVCFNCHRRDVYGDPNLTTPSTTNNVYRQTRQPHASYLDSNGSSNASTASKWPQHCRACHGGDKLGGIHGTNSINASTGGTGTKTNKQGKRFLNGSSWGTNTSTTQYLARSTTSTTGSCYTANIANATVDSCGKGHTGTAYANPATYNYDNP